MNADPAPMPANVRQTAAFWFTRARAGDMSAEEARQFEVWLARSPAHTEAYGAIERMWIDAIGVIDDPAIIASRERNARRLDTHARFWRASAAAASLLVAVGSGWMLARAGVFDRIAQLSSGDVHELRTSVGQRTLVTLPDKSVVMLDTDTVLRLRQTMWQRRVELMQGRAYFDVAKDRSRPFIVAAAGKTVRATGTAFDVRVEQDGVEVTLVEGRVRVKSDRGDGGDPRIADMRAGWRLSALGETNWRMSPVDVDKVTSWHDGVLTFNHDRLVDAVSEMNRYSRKKIVLREDVPEAIVAGVFAAGDVDGFVNAMTMNKFAQVAEKNEERIELRAP